MYRRAKKARLRMLEPILGRPYRLTIHEQRRFIYVRVPKVATHSMNGWLGGTFDPPPQWHELEFLPSDLEGWYVFTLVRNPWDRISATWREKAAGARQPAQFYSPWAHRPFADFVRALADLDLDRVEAHVRRQTALVPVERMNYVGRLEEVEVALAEIADCLGVSTRAFQQLNRGPSRLRGDYRQMYDDRTAGLLGELYAEEIDAFGYTFDGVVTPE